MRKLIFIISVLVVSCTAKKTREESITTPGTEQDTVVSKRFLYVDTVEEAASTTIEYDTAQTVVQAPVEESKTYETPKAEEEAAQDTIEIDTTVYRWDLVIAPDSVKEWKRLKSFAYVKNLDSLLKAAREKNKKQEKQQRHEEVSYNRGGSSWLDAMLGSEKLKIFLWIIAGAFVLFVIYKLFVTESSLKRKSGNKTADEGNVEEEVITPETDIDRLIREAVQQSAYRLAVRYHYLQSLHLLAEKGHVQLAADKTNYSYVREIADYGRQNRFAEITRNYEYVWYGEFEIDELIYLKLKNLFQTFNTTL
ncbi:MAG: DUF4129 domain-containing protein [Ferruginibacter sp.]